MSSPITSSASSSTLLSSSSRRLEGKVALVTGGASGIGESIVRLFHRQGAKVCILDIQDNLGLSLCEELLGGECSCCYIHGDVTVEDDISRAVDFTVEKFGTVDIMVNNAGIAGLPVSDVRSYDFEEFKKTIGVNVCGVFLGVKHAARVMIPRCRGSIVSLGSVSGVTGGMGPHGYTASKHAVVGLTKSFAAEMGKHGIRVNCVSPYAVPTGLSFNHAPPEERTEDDYKSFLEFVGSKANLKGVSLMPEDVAQAVLYLASDDSRYVSGLNLVVDGGVTCVNHDLRVFRS